MPNETRMDKLCPKHRTERPRQHSREVARAIVLTPNDARAPRPWRLLRAALLASSAVLLAALLAHCSSPPPEEPTRIMERAEKIDVVCLKIFENGKARTPLALPKNDCALPVANASRANDEAHLFALVTQTARGEVAVVDLTGFNEVDVDLETPGRNLLPVGRLPVDIKTSPDGRYAVVATAESTRPALFAIPTERVLGNAQAGPGAKPPALNEWPSCVLPDRPVALAFVDGDPAVAGAPRGTLVVALGGSRLAPARLATMPVSAFAGDVKPGAIAECPLTQLAPAKIPAFLAAESGPSWGDGVGYLNREIDTTLDVPQLGASCTQEPAGGDGGADGGGVDGGATDSGIDAGADAAADSAIDAAVDAAVDSGGRGRPSTLRAEDARFGAMATVGDLVYVADLGLPLIHVYRIISGRISTLEPLVVNSQLDADAKPTVKALAASPLTRAGKRFLYAIEDKSGSVLVYDITNPATSPHVPLTRPHPELNPFQAPDRLTFALGATALSFVEQGYEAKKPDASTFTDRTLCDPRPTLDRSVALGANFSAQGAQAFPPGPSRLRGIFALVALVSGEVLFVDVEDWDAPCRRPADMTGQARSSFAPAPTDDPTNPYALLVARTGEAATPTEYSTNESVYPAVVPHRLRSSSTLLNDRGQNSNRIPHLAGLPTLYRDRDPATVAVAQRAELPLMLPAQSPYAAPSFLLAGKSNADATAADLANPVYFTPGNPSASPQVRFSHEVADVHLDQDWSIAYEGVVPGLGGVLAEIATTDGYSSLELRQREAFFCRQGVEDLALGRERALAAEPALVAAGLPALVGTPGDYVQLADDLLAPTDPYWQNPDTLRGFAALPEAARSGYEFCQKTYGTSAGASPARDFPILQAYEDKLVIGRFEGTGDARVARPADANNQVILRAMQLCFHNQVRFNVRTGGEWLASGSAVGTLHHVVADDARRCVQSCSTREALLNSRAISIPRALPNAPRPFVPPFRNSPLAMRNPAFSLVMYEGIRQSTLVGAAPVRVPATRDLSWRFSTAGQFGGLAVRLTAGSISTSPRSILALPNQLPAPPAGAVGEAARPLSSRGQFAVVDGQLQGLSVFDLSTIGLTRSPYL